MSLFRPLIVTMLLIMLSSFTKVSAQDEKHSLWHEGRLRTYWVHLPKDYTPQNNYPLVLALHGGGGTAKRFNRSTRSRFNELADEENFVLVYPQGVKKSWNDNRKRDTLGAARKLDIDDVGFIEKMIAALETDYSINSNAIFSCGISNGGLMSLTLATALPGKIKAIGMVASNFSEAQAQEMENASPFSCLIIHGTEDPIFPYEEGDITIFKQRRGKVLGFEKSLELMRNLNGNFTPAIVRVIPNSSKKDGCTAVYSTFPNPNNPHWKLDAITVIGGGHTWPGGTQYLPKKFIGKTSRDFNACDSLWEFFKSTID
ncbi:MAG: PHB depolymerase family esterase [Bacteroidota bacterium]